MTWARRVVRSRSSPASDPAVRSWRLSVSPAVADVRVSRARRVAASSI
jgi:hypothetical protein